MHNLSGSFHTADGRLQKLLEVTASKLSSEKKKNFDSLKQFEYQTGGSLTVRNRTDCALSDNFFTLDRLHEMWKCYIIAVLCNAGCVMLRCNDTVCNLM